MYIYTHTRTRTHTHTHTHTLYIYIYTYIYIFFFFFCFLLGCGLTWRGLVASIARSSLGFGVGFLSLSSKIKREKARKEGRNKCLSWVCASTTEIASLGKYMRWRTWRTALAKPPNGNAEAWACGLDVDSVCGWFFWKYPVSDSWFLLDEYNPCSNRKRKKKSKFKKPFAAAQKTRNENAKSGQEGFPGGPSNPTSLQLARMSFHFNFFLFGKKIEEKEYKGL